MDSVEQFFSKLLFENYEVGLFTEIFLFLWLTYLFKLYLEYRQIKILISNKKPTKEASMIMTDENFNKERSYSIDTKRFKAYHNFYNMIQLSILLCCNILPKIWGHSLSVVTDSSSFTESQELMASTVFILIFIMYTKVTDMPWKAYSTFVIEARHGFNKQTPFFFIKDQIKDLLNLVLIVVPISYLLLLIIKRGGPQHCFCVYDWGFAFVAMIFLMFIYQEFVHVHLPASFVLMVPISYCSLFIIKRDGPQHCFCVYDWRFDFVSMIYLMLIYQEIITPLFDKYTPLADGKLKQDIETLAKEMGFPLTKLYVVEGSKRPRHSYAYFYGFWRNKRIVLFDTLIDNYVSPGDDDTTTKGDVDPTKTETGKGCSNEEIIAVLCHELGHWKLNHVLQNMVVNLVNVFVMFFSFAMLYNCDVLFKAFGFVGCDTATIIQLVIIVSYYLSPYRFMLECVRTLLSRRNEFQADNFATKLGKGDKLIDALVKLHNDNPSFPIYDRMYSLFNNSHPPILERIKAIRSEVNSKRIQ